jgi:fermentation-respiration switch protein FrsA (DUF1100 family)
MGAVLIRIVGIYLLVMIVMYVAQRDLEYFPDRTPPGAPKDSNVPEMKLVSFTTEDGITLSSWFGAPRKKEGRIVVLFHGNGGNMTHRAMKARYFLDKGFGVLLAEYRGYGGSKGSPSEQGLYKDGRAALKWLESEGYSPSQFVLYGESLGTGVAVQMALESQPKILILETPFSSATDIAKKLYFWLPVDLLIKDKFDSASKIGGIRSSLFIIHGDEDETIPIAYSHKLFEAANHPKEYVTINGGGHSDLYEHHAGHIITEWLEKQP